MMMKTFYRNLCIAFVCILMVSLNSAYAQGLVNGTVSDSNGEPLPGVNVIVKGTTNGTTTDAQGKFALQASENDIIVISFIGYATSEVPVGTQTQITVTLADDVTQLGEVVVVGYGEQKKALNTGANLQVKGEDLMKLSTTNALQALQGQAPGVQITSTSGQPGEPIKVIIRGQGSIGGSNPLYVVDGVLTGDISYLNNADIQSIDVLKDAASAAIYGSQASNGVVLITTKKGRSGQKGQITFDTYIGVQNVARKAKLLNAQEYASIMNEAAVNSGKLPYYSPDSIAHMGAGTNWMDKMFVKNAPTRNYSLGMSGGNETSVYSTSLSLVQQAGIVGGKSQSNYDRYNFRFNSEHKLYKNLIVLGENMTFAYTNNNGVSVAGNYNNTLRGAFNTTPMLVDSRTDTVGMFNQANPYNEMVVRNQNRNSVQKLLGNMYLQAEPIRNLKIRTSFGMDFSSSDYHSYTPDFTLSIYSFNHPNKVAQSMSKNKTFLWDNLITYGFNVASDHHFDILAGTSSYQFSGSNMYASNSNIVFTDLDHAWLSNATNKDGARMSVSGGPAEPNKRMSYFGRLNYNFKETYLLNATFRADGSSQFAKSHQWGYFPSVSGGWVMTNENFLGTSRTWLDFLKVRASWGQVGNQNVFGFPYLAPVTFTNTNYIFGPTEGSNGLVPGAYPSRLANPNLKWETSVQTDIGFDARFLAGKLTMNFDWYNKTSKDWLISVPVLATAGVTDNYINGGNVTNKGIELALMYNDRIGDVNFRIGVNGAHNTNKVTNIPTLDGIIHPAESSNQLYNNAPEFYRAQTGQPLGYFWGLKTAGIFQTEADVSNYRSTEGGLLQPTAKPGDVRYVDTNKDGVIDALDKVNIGNPNPKYTFGFTFAFDYKGLDFSVLASGVAGNKLVQSYRDQSSPNGNYTRAILDRWHGPGSSNSTPRVTENNSNFTNFSDLYIHDGSFLRISNVTIGYNFAKFLPRNVVSQFRLYASVLNLYTFTKYNGMDPEIGYGPNSFASGIDLGYYPRPRTMMVGLNVKF